MHYHLVTCFTALPFSHMGRQLRAMAGRSLSGPPQAPPALGNANALEEATATWNHPPKEITKCSWIIFPAQPDPVEIQRTSTGYLLTTYYTPRESATVSGVSAETQGRPRSQRASQWKKEGRLQVCPDWSAVGMGKLGAGWLEMRHPSWLVRGACFGLL